MNELKERYSKKNSNIEDYCIGKLVNKGNLPKNKAVKEKEKKKKKELKLEPWCCYIGSQPQSLQICFKSKPINKIKSR